MFERVCGDAHCLGFGRLGVRTSNAVLICTSPDVRHCDRNDVPLCCELPAACVHVHVCVASLERLRNASCFRSHKCTLWHTETYVEGQASFFPQRDPYPVSMQGSDQRDTATNCKCAQKKLGPGRAAWPGRKQRLHSFKFDASLIGSHPDIPCCMYL